MERAHRGGERVLLNDGDGLYFRKQTQEGAAWTLRYRFSGRERWMTLGNHPDMSLAQTRIEAREKRTLLDKQRDPLQEKAATVEAQRAAAAALRARQPFRRLAEEWFEAEIIGQIKHPQAPRRYLDKYLIPEFADPPINSTERVTLGSELIGECFEGRSSPASASRTPQTVKHREHPGTRRQQQAHALLVGTG